MSDITDDPNAAESEFYTLHEIVAKAQKNLPRDQWDYLVGATETETPLRRNRQSLDTLAFKPRVCRNVLDVDVSGSLLGQKMRIPVLLPRSGRWNPSTRAAAPPPARRRKHSTSSIC